MGQETSSPAPATVGGGCIGSSPPAPNVSLCIRTERVPPGVWVTGPFDLNEGNLLALIRD